MTAQEYIKSKLEDLRRPLALPRPANDDELAVAIYKFIMSKKFRKYSITPELDQHIRGAINLAVKNNKPVNFTFLHGAYKLWRLDEAPEPDWAELFSILYYSNWVKPICEIFEPGVWFDCFVDDLIVPKIDNIDPADIDKYLEVYKQIFDYIEPYQPPNLKMTYTRVGDQFESPAAFDTSLEKNIEAMKKELPNGLPVLDEAKRAMVELNTKPTKEQLTDPNWREKVALIHDAYMNTKAEPGYHNQPSKIKVFSQPLPSGMVIAPGSTKDSVAKFWVGVGVLKPRDSEYRQIILSPSQLETAKYDWQDVELDIPGKNFNRIRVLNEN
jgi:hypothetical protein